jgi:hypothetical protein
MYIQRFSPKWGIFCATSLLFPAIRPAWCWGNEGHHAAGLVAQTQLSSRAKKAVKSLVGKSTLRDLATCADEVRTHERNPSFVLSAVCGKVFPSPQPTGTANWHFIDLDVKSADPDDTAMDAFCNTDCVVAKIISFHSVLSDKTASGPLRAQALAFLVHFVGDVHQPLHAAQRDQDRGGNLVTVGLVTSPGSPRKVVHENLHAVWDTGIIQLMAADEQGLVGIMTTQIAAARKETVPPQIAAWVHSWAKESEDLARSQVYKDNNQDIDASSKPELSQNYEKNAEGVISDQIARAGFRLATLINLALK